MAFKPIDPKRDEFRRYLERSGVIEALTKVFVRIVKERPENPLDYLRNNLGDALHQADNMAYLQSELEEARSEIQRLRGIIESINPDALMEQQHLQDDLEKKVDETPENQEKSSEEEIKAQEDSKSVSVANEVEIGSKEDALVQSNSSNDDKVKNSETPDNSDSANNTSNLAVTQNDNN